MNFFKSNLKLIKIFTFHPLSNIVSFLTLFKTLFHIIRKFEQRIIIRTYAIKYWVIKNFVKKFRFTFTVLFRIRNFIFVPFA